MMMAQVLWAGIGGDDFFGFGECFLLRPDLPTLSFMPVLAAGRAASFGCCFPFIPTFRM
jgi:hypothetical protein